MTSYHSHSSDKKVRALVEELKAGKDIALISDAGTPGISDPAWSLIKAAREEEITIIPVPGPAAFLAALSGSGLPMDKFTYLGFVPAKKGRQKLFKSILDETRTVALYESPHRILKTLVLMADILGPDRKIVLARELTKVHETFHRGTIAQLQEEFADKAPKGEIVLLIAPANF